MTYKNRNNYTCWNRERYILASCDICDEKYWRPDRYRPERNPKFWAGELTTGYHTKHVCSSICHSILNSKQRRKYTRENPGIDQHGYPYYLENGKVIKETPPAVRAKWKNTFILNYEIAAKKIVSSILGMEKISELV